MRDWDIKQELATMTEEIGEYPMRFFCILRKSENENVDFDKQNERHAYIKAEEWHSLDLANHKLWAISDNGDLLWSNGEQTIAMHPRDMQFMSVSVRPSQFMRLLISGHSLAYFPKGLFDNAGAV